MFEVFKSFYSFFTLVPVTQNYNNMDRIKLLGYQLSDSDLLSAAFPDIRNQFLEVKVQDSLTVDLGKFSPETEEIVIKDSDLTSFDVRYLIALTNPETEIIEGIILSPGEKLGEFFLM